jgi:hypothetical protein
MSVAISRVADGDWEGVRQGFDTTARNLRPPMPNARVYGSAHGVINNGAFDTILFDSEEYDVGGMHSTSVNTGRLTSTVTGVYVITGQVNMTALTAGGRLMAHIFKNGTEIARSSTVTVGGSDVNVGTQTRMARGDWIELRIQNLTGLAMTPAAGAGFTYLVATRLGGYTNEGTA